MTNDTTEDLLPGVIKTLRKILKPGEKNRADEVESIWALSGAGNPKAAWALAGVAFGFADDTSEIDKASAAAAAGKSTPAFDRWMRRTTPGHASFEPSLNISPLTPVREIALGYGRYPRPFYRLSAVLAWSKQIKAHETAQAAARGRRKAKKSKPALPPLRLQTIHDGTRLRLPTWTYEGAVVTILVGSPDLSALAFAHRTGLALVVESLTLREALTERVWLDPEMRSVWTAAYRELLEREAHLLARADARQASVDENSALRQGLDAQRTEPLPAGGGRRPI